MITPFYRSCSRPFRTVAMLSLTVLASIVIAGPSPALAQTKFMKQEDVDRIINDSGPSRVQDTKPKVVQGAPLVPADLSRNIALMKGILLLNPAEGSELVRTRLFTKMRVAGEGAVELALPDGTMVLENIANIQELICFMPAYQGTRAFEQNDELGLIGKMSNLNVPIELAEKKDVDAAKVFIDAMKVMEARMQEAKNPPAVTTYSAVRKAMDIAIMRYDSGQRFYREKWMTAAEYLAQRNHESGMQH
ncbi:MAG: hypothetical protein ACAI35_25200 [Candidatus Methylacidiphilales bacterium]|nr:hypothetical protein [Candidatus Methylacidiphilales bacterium]